jgi:hypothetical protein
MLRGKKMRAAHQEIDMKINVNTNTDVHLVTMMVAKVLKDEHQIDEAPSFADYEVMEADVRPNRSTDIRVAIPLGRGISIDVKQHWWGDGNRDLSELAETAIGIAENFASVHEMKEDILAMTKEVRTAASREIAKANRRGLEYRLVSVVPGADNSNVSEGVVVDVTFERLSENLRPKLASFAADCAADVAGAFKADREAQEQRVARRLHLNDAGATGRIDSVVVNAMREAGHNVAEVLKLLATAVDQIVDVGDHDEEVRQFHSGKRDEGKKWFRLYLNDGDVYARIEFGDGISWQEGKLSFQKAPLSLTKAKGRPVRDIVNNSNFGDIRVQSGSGKKGEYVVLYCTEDLLYFDADTGRLWPA